VFGDVFEEVRIPIFISPISVSKTKPLSNASSNSFCVLKLNVSLHGGHGSAPSAAAA
jgi:hypothetical protein